MSLPECFLLKKERKELGFAVFFLLVLFHVSVFAVTTSCYHCRLPGHSVSRLRISLLLYSMFCLPRLFLFVATLQSAAYCFFALISCTFAFLQSCFAFFYSAPLADMLVTSSIILRGLQIQCYYYYY